MGRRSCFIAVARILRIPLSRMSPEEIFAQIRASIDQCVLGVKDHNFPVTPESAARAGYIPIFFRRSLKMTADTCHLSFP